MWGAILQPVTSDLAAKLGAVRFKHRFVHAIHFSRKSNFTDNESKVIKGFLDAFIESEASYRSIVADPAKWSKLSDWSSKARLAGTLFTYPWMPAENQLFQKLSRARIIFDRNSMTLIQMAQFKESLNRTLKKKYDTPTQRLQKSSMVFADTRIFDELQLVDILNGIIRVSYLKEKGVSVPRAKLEMHDHLLHNFPQLKSFVKASRFRSRQKINVWEHEPKL